MAQVNNKTAKEKSRCYRMKRKSQLDQIQYAINEIQHQILMIRYGHIEIKKEKK